MPTTKQFDVMIIDKLKLQLEEARNMIQQCTTELIHTQKINVDLNALTDVQDQEILSLDQEMNRLERENIIVKQRYTELDQIRRQERKQADNSLRTIQQLSSSIERLRQTIRSTEIVESKLRDDARKAELQMKENQDSIEDYMESSILCKTDRHEEQSIYKESLKKCTDRVLSCENLHNQDTSSHCSQCQLSM
jgi:DNA repair exonuclease SbcCD ATPase subunit